MIENANVTPIQTQYTEQIHGTGQQYGSLNITNQALTLIPESQGSHISAKVDALRR